MRLTLMTEWTLHILCPLRLVARPQRVQERREGEQILGPKRGTPCGDHRERIGNTKAGPRRRYAASTAVVRLEPHAVPVPISALIDKNEGTAVQRVERMRDRDPTHRVVGAGCT